MSELQQKLAEKKRAFLAKADQDDPDAPANSAQERPADQPTAVTPSDPPPEAPRARKRALEASPKRKGDETYPWESADPRVPAHFTMRAKAPLHAKLVYVHGETKGGKSMHTIALEILEQGLNERLRAMGARVD